MSEYEKWVMNQFENKLIELMGPEAYSAWAVEVAKAAFRKEVESMPAGDFKDFILETIDSITEEPYEK